FKPRRDFPQFRIRIVCHFARRLIGEQKFGDHFSRGLGAIGLRAHLHARRRRADAACRQHPLAFNFDHADAAIAVGPLAGLRQVAQMGQLDAEPTRRAENRLAVANIDLAVVDGESLASRLGGGFASHVRSAGRWPFMRNMHAALVLDRAAGCALLIVPVTGRFLFVAIAHRVQNLDYQCPSGLVSSSGKYFNTHSKGFGAACPSPQIDASRISTDSSSSSAAFHGPLAISCAAFSVPTRQGVHWPQLSSSKNFIKLSATAFISSCSDRITPACAPGKQPYFASVPKSSGISAIDAGKMPPDAPPGRHPLKPGPSAIPPQNSSISSRTVTPAGASLTPGFLTRPETEKLRKPLRSCRPCEVNQSTPRSTMSRTQNS